MTPTVTPTVSPTTGGGGVQLGAAQFNGTNNRMYRNLSGGGTVKTMTFAGWFSPDNVSGVEYLFAKNTTDYVQRSGTSLIANWTSGGATRMRFTLTNVFAATTWVHIAFSFDLNNTSNRYVYINGSNETSSVTWNTYSNTTVTHSGTHVVGALSNGASPFDGAISQVYYDDAYVDLSSEIGSIYSSGPVNYDDTDLTGGQPLLFINGDRDESDFNTNDGSGGTPLTINGPALTSATGPST